MGFLSGRRRRAAALMCFATVAAHDKRGPAPDEVAEAALGAIDKHLLVVPAARRPVTAPDLLHRLSPRLIQPIARDLKRIVSWE
jgi:hypothetical protein